MAPPSLQNGARGADASAAALVLVSGYGRRPLVQIFVRDNNVDQALKALKKKMQREGTFREMKRRNHYEKPSEKRARERAEAVRRARKLARKRAQREGLLPKPPPRPR
ncbi:MAG: 30S ribosomal protein S21 [Hyphomonadaceae bacterium]|nr:30S ribosomal protein S21 [Hyphomonadaceae bacterium]